MAPAGTFVHKGDEVPHLPRVITLGVIEDNPTTLAAILDALAVGDGFRVVWTATSCAETRAQLSREIPDVLLVDLGLPDGQGRALIAEARQRRADVEAVVITMFGDESHVIDAIEAGATGYLLKDDAVAELPAALRLLLAGGAPMSPSIARLLVQRTRQQASGIGPTETFGLTTRERELLDLLARGYTYGEVGRLLDISLHTVQTHIKRVYAKMSVHSRAEAVYEARQHRLL
jgi:DNA-binding NarL/FixJ family response regulator